MSLEYDRFLVDQVIRPVANLYRVTPLAVGDTPALAVGDVDFSWHAAAAKELEKMVADEPVRPRDEEEPSTLDVQVDADLGAMPDQVTTVAALAALADGTSHLRGVAVARGHETDRLAALAAELGKAGVGVDEQRDGLVIRGATARGPARLDTYSDHRLAMAFAALGARVPGIVVEDPGCVAKTYPRFWQDLATLGVEVRPR
jgi:5-enolpyruvylshikimate-3-phosphate synthase